MRKLRYAPRHHTPERIAKERTYLVKARAERAARRTTGTTYTAGDTLPVGWLSPLLRSGWDVTLFLSTPQVHSANWYLAHTDYYSGLESFPHYLYPPIGGTMSKGPGRYELAPSQIHKAARVDREPNALLENLHFAAQELLTLSQSTLDDKLKILALKEFRETQAEQVRTAKNMQLIVQGISEERWTKIKVRLMQLVEEHPELEKDIRKALEG